MATPKTKYLMWFIALVLVMACVPAVAAPAVPTTDPNTIGTFIVQTANAASTRTALAMPTSTPTATFTPTPRNIDTPEPTATATVLFLFYTPSPVILTQSSNNSGSGTTTSSKDYACEILSVTPANGTIFGTRADFDAKWKVKNIGQKNWDKDSVDYLYSTGDKFHKVAGYDLSKTINRGDPVDLIADMESPKNPGTYTTNWALHIGTESFCTLSLTIVVK